MTKINELMNEIRKELEEKYGVDPGQIKIMVSCHEVEASLAHKIVGETGNETEYHNAVSDYDNRLVEWHNSKNGYNEITAFHKKEVISRV